MAIWPLEKKRILSISQLFPYNFQNEQFNYFYVLYGIYMTTGAKARTIDITGFPPLLEPPTPTTKF